MLPVPKRMTILKGTYSATWTMYNNGLLFFFSLSWAMVVAYFWGPRATWRLLCRSSLSSVLQPIRRKWVIAIQELHRSLQISAAAGNSGVKAMTTEASFTTEPVRSYTGSYTGAPSRPNQILSICACIHIYIYTYISVYISIHLKP